MVQENQILHWQVRGKQGRSAWPEEWYSMQQVTFKAKHRTMGEHKDKGKFNTGRKGKSFSIWRCGPSLPCRPTPLSGQVGMQNWIVKITPRRHLLHNYQHTNRTYGEGWKEIGATHQFCHRTGALLRWPCPLVFWAPCSSSPWMNAPEFTWNVLYFCDFLALSHLEISAARPPSQLPPPLTSSQPTPSDSNLVFGLIGFT